MIFSREVPTGTGRVTFLEPTEKGWEYLESLGHFKKNSRYKGGYAHEYWKKKIGNYLREKGYEVIEEKPIGDGKSVDLVATDGEEEMAIEIETGKSDSMYNIRKDMDAGFDKVYSVALSRRVRDKIIREAKEGNLLDTPGLEIMYVSDFLKS